MWFLVPMSVMIASSAAFSLAWVELPDDMVVYKCKRLRPLAVIFTANNVYTRRTGISPLISRFASVCTQRVNQPATGVRYCGKASAVCG